MNEWILITPIIIIIYYAGEIHSRLSSINRILRWYHDRDMVIEEKIRGLSK
jgi:hypothetical protein